MIHDVTELLCLQSKNKFTKHGVRVLYYVYLERVPNARDSLLGGFLLLFACVLKQVLFLKTCMQLTCRNRCSSPLMSEQELLWVKELSLTCGELRQG